MRIERYARAAVIERYELEIDEALVNEINESVKNYKPDFVNLTLEDLIIFVKDKEEHPREMEEISYSFGKGTLGDHIRCYINDKVWENYIGVDDSETYDWDDCIMED